MHYIKDIYENKVTDHAHQKFVRYSKGTFVGPLIKIKVTKATVKLSASFHFVDELLLMLADVIGDRVIHIKGFLIWNTDLSSDLAKLGIKYSKVTKSRGIFKYVIDNDVNIKHFVEAFNRYHVLISVKSEDISFVTKSAFPKPNKPFSHDFCKVSFPGTYAKKLLADFAFDVKVENIKDFYAEHEIIIDEINIPTADTFDEARRLAKRIGTLKRTITVNGNQKESHLIKINV